MKNLLIVVDYQNDFVCGSLGFAGAEKLEGPIIRKIEQYLERGDCIAFTLDTHGPGYLNTQEGRRLPVPHCINGEDGHRLYGGVSDYSGRGVSFIKSSFGSPELFCHLQSNKYARIELVGLVSNICVLANAVLCKTAQPETEIVVDAACTASFDADLHKKTLDILSGLQVTVINA